MLDQQRERPVVLLAGVRGVQLSEAAVHLAPRLHVLLTVLDARDRRAAVGSQAGSQRGVSGGTKGGR